MILIVCAMAEERDAFLEHMSEVKIRKGRSFNYHGEKLDNEYYVGRIEGKDVVVIRSGVGEVYATMSTLLAIEKFKPELVINVGIAGSLSEDIHVNDVVVATKAAHWRFLVPGPEWKRCFNNDKIVFSVDEELLNKSRKALRNVKFGPIVSADEFIYKKSQVKEIKKYYPEALCGEMEGAAIANTCYATDTKWMIIRSISDETLVSNNFKMFDFNLDKACKKAAKIAVSLIKRC